jgi:asparagine synthase (glutamine-hydrolysing)
MCGIVGIASSHEQCDQGKLLLMRDTMHHRGPDDRGVWINPDFSVGLAHTRLSIIDLSPKGHQPMSDSSGRYWITFNGEIYNYQDLREGLTAKGHSFQTKTDTEAILEAYREWGTECVTHLNGMFAFAIYDSLDKCLFIARDRAGEKPLYYYHFNKRFSFASELKAFMVDPDFSRSYSLEALNEYLAFGYISGTNCILKGVSKLPAGHALKFNLTSNDLTIWRYWDLPNPIEAKEIDQSSEEELLEDIEDLLLDSVRMRMVADVPVGILLSGGLDSSLVTALAVKSASKPVRTFTITFPGHGTFNEGPYANIVAQHFCTEHTELEASEATYELLPRLATQYDEPMADSSMIPTYLVSKLIREHATVALGGDGGDELFGGYPHYSWLTRQDQLRQLLPAAVRKSVSTAAARFLPAGFHGRNYLLSLGGTTADSIAHVNVYFDNRLRQKLLKPCWEEISLYRNPQSAKADLCLKDLGLVQQASLVDFQTYLTDDILVKVDRASMLNSLEVRAPMLDHRLIELAFSKIPGTKKANSNTCKILLRRLGRKLLPPELNLERKQGFSLPISDWFTGKWGEVIQENLQEVDPHVFDRKQISSLFKLQRQGFKNAHRLFALVMFELWRQQYNVKPG